MKYKINLPLKSNVYEILFGNIARQQPVRPYPLTFSGSAVQYSSDSLSDTPMKTPVLLPRTSVGFIPII